MKKIIVAVSGGFDPIHYGHIKLFREARKLGDKLIVILNSDNFLMKKKGFVLMNFKHRKRILKAIKYVDKVIKCRDKDLSVCKTLAKLKPDIFANGGDRQSEKDIPEDQICEKLGIKMVFNVGGHKIYSSSDLIKKINYEKLSNML